MKLELVPSSVDGNCQTQFLSSYLINGHLAVDAGSIGFVPDLTVQQAVKHILLTHAHIDHLASLGPLIDNTCETADEPLTIHCSAEVAECLKRHYFNGSLWPDVLRLPSAERPYARLQVFQPLQTFSVAGFEVLPVPVDHSVPCCGFLIRHDRTTILLSGDTGSTEQIWKAAKQYSDLKAVVLEVAFPNELKARADMAMHLTPKGFEREVAKLGEQRPKLFAVHLKAPHQDRIVQQLDELGLDDLHRLEAGRVYEL